MCVNNNKADTMNCFDVLNRLFCVLGNYADSSTHCGLFRVFMFCLSILLVLTGFKKVFFPNVSIIEKESHANTQMSSASKGETKLTG